MSVVGIIAEYNPLHCGHEYHIRMPCLTGAEACVCVLSSNFVQPVGLVSKWARTKMALLSELTWLLSYPLSFPAGRQNTFCRSNKHPRKPWLY